MKIKYRARYEREVDCLISCLAASQANNFSFFIYDRLGCVASIDNQVSVLSNILEIVLTVVSCDNDAIDLRNKLVGQFLTHHHGAVKMHFVYMRVVKSKMLCTSLQKEFHDFKRR